MQKAKHTATLLLTILIHISPLLWRGAGGEVQAQTYQWAHGFGGPMQDSEGSSIATDAQGNVYVTGTFGDSIDFNPSGLGTAYLVADASNLTSFIAKYDSSGNYIWAKSLDVSPFGNCWIEKIVVNNTGIYITGHFFLYIDFDPGLGSAVLISTGGWSGDEDIFIAHYDLNGNYLWAKSMGGLNEDRTLDMAVDNNSNIYLTGYFKDTADFDPDAGSATLVSTGFADTFFAKYDANGNYIWAYDLCDANGAASGGRVLTVDKNANSIYVSGTFSSTVDFDRGGGTYFITDTNQVATYIAKYDTSGSFIWAGNFDGSSSVSILDIYVNEVVSNDFYICGSLWGTADFDLNSTIFNVTSTGNNIDAYFAKYSSGKNLVWVKSLNNNGSGNIVVGKSINVDNNSNVYLAGYFSGMTDFDPNGGIANITANGNLRDIFFAKYGNSGNYLWAKGIGGLYEDRANSLTLDLNGGIYLTGFFRNTIDADPDTGFATLSPATSQNIFIGKYANTFTGIFEGKKDISSSLVVYPNPANEIITVINKENNPSFDSKIIVTNAMGEIVYQKYFSISQQQLKININFLPPGLYCITSVENTKTVSVKFVIK